MMRERLVGRGLAALLVELDQDDGVRRAVLEAGLDGVHDDLVGVDRALARSPPASVQPRSMHHGQACVGG